MEQGGRNKGGATESRGSNKGTVHSHVEATKGAQEGEPAGKKQKRRGGAKQVAKQGQQETPRCACGGAKGKCDPDHRHHKGNDVADELANQGRAMPTPCTSYHSSLCGEERVHNGMVREGRVCEGDITKETKAANRQRLRTTMREGKAHMRQLADNYAGEQQHSDETQGNEGEDSEHAVQGHCGPCPTRCLQ